jgi:hypothetical protein
MSDMSYVDAQVQDTTPFSGQTSFGGFFVGPKTVGRARGISSDGKSDSEARGSQSTTPTAAKGGSAFGADSELAMAGDSPALMSAAPVNWLAIAGIGVGVLSILVALFFRRR